MLYVLIMSNRTVDFLTQREGEIEGEIKALNDELRGIYAAKQAMGIFVRPVDKVSAPNVNPIADSGQRMSNMGMVKAVLADFPDGKESNDLLSIVKERFGVEIPRSSLSPQLSKLKKKGEVKWRGGKWKLNKPALPDIMA